MVLSPGIDPDSPLAQNFSSRNIEMIGELELGWRFCEVPVIAITGTNGKTTTTELLAQMLNACGQRTDRLRQHRQTALAKSSRDRSKFDVLTVEVSSFQLETIKTFRPQIAVWLNFAPDHLDRYRSVAEYRAAKLRIFENQTAKDVAVVNASENLPQIAARQLTFSAYDDRADFRLAEGSIVFRDEPVLRLAETKLRGSHNIENLMATLAVGHGARIVLRANGAAACVLTSRARTAVNSSGRSAASITSTIPRRRISMRWKKRCRPKPSRSFSSPAEKTRVSISNRCAILVKEKVRTAILIGEMAKRIAR